MITPISNNLNSASNLSAIERPRVPRRSNAVYSISFSGTEKLASKASGIKGFFGKIIHTVKEKAEGFIHSKAVRGAKRTVKKGIHKAADFLISIPKAIGKFFGGIIKKITKKA